MLWEVKRDKTPLASLLQISIQKFLNSFIAVNPIFPFGKAVSFIIKNSIFNREHYFFYSSCDFIRFRLKHTRVIGPRSTINGFLIFSAWNNGEMLRSMLYLYTDCLAFYIGRYVMWWNIDRKLEKSTRVADKRTGN